MMPVTPTSAGWFSQLSEQDFDLLGRVDAGAWVVLQVLRWYARTGSTCFPNVETIGKLAHLKERSVRHALVRLVKANLIDREIESGKRIFRLLGYDAGVTPSDGRSDTGVRKPLTPVSATPDTGVRKPLTPVSAEIDVLNKTQEVDARKERKTRGCAAPPDSDGRCRDLLELWNAVPGVTQARKVSKARQAALAARLGEDPDWWQQVPEALEKIAASGFLGGENERSWTITLDWFLRSGSIDKILEGQYE
jgi:DNA-binding transcriptional ArsR family regulator